MLTVGSLFAGIGGFDLGFERAGMRTLWQVEQSEFCRRVLERHFPDAKRYGDVRSVVGRPSTHGNSLEYVDVICGGFPCQDLSLAGQRAGIDGEQSGLWAEMFRIVCELRPRYLVVENVPGLLSSGLGRVLGDLAQGGFDAEWDCLPAAAFGAPHYRDRFWLVAYPSGPRRREDAGSAHGDEGADAGRRAAHDHEPDGHGEGGRARDVADPTSDGRRQGRPRRLDPSGTGQPEQPLPLADADREQAQRPSVARAQRDPWPAEPALPRMAHGVPNGLDRRRALGNSLIPQAAEWIGRRIIEWEEGAVAA